MRYLVCILKNSLHLLLLLFIVSLTGCTSKTKNIVFENKYFKYEIDPSGKNLHFIDKQNKVDCLSEENISYCASVKKDDIEYNVTGLSLDGETLKLNFDEAGVTAALQVITTDNHIKFKVKEVTGEPWSLTFINIPLNLDGMSYEPFGACILAMNLNTHVTQMPALQTFMEATSYKRLGMEGSEISMLGLPQDMMLSTIREIVKNTEAIPFSDRKQKEFPAQC